MTRRCLHALTPTTTGTTSWVSVTTAPTPSTCTPTERKSAPSRMRPRRMIQQVGGESVVTGPSHGRMLLTDTLRASSTKFGYLMRLAAQTGRRPSTSTRTRRAATSPLPGLLPCGRGPAPPQHGRRPVAGTREPLQARPTRLSSALPPVAPSSTRTSRSSSSRSWPGTAWTSTGGH